MGAEAKALELGLEFPDNAERAYLNTTSSRARDGISRAQRARGRRHWLVIDGILGIPCGGDPDEVVTASRASADSHATELATKRFPPPTRYQQDKVVSC